MWPSWLLPSLLSLHPSPLSLPHLVGGVAQQEVDDDVDIVGMVPRVEHPRPHAIMVHISCTRASPLQRPLFTSRPPLWFTPPLQTRPIFSVPSSCLICTHVRSTYTSHIRNTHVHGTCHTQHTSQYVPYATQTSAPHTQHTRPWYMPYATHVHSMSHTQHKRLLRIRNTHVHGTPVRIKSANWSTPLLCTLHPKHYTQKSQWFTPLLCTLHHKHLLCTTPYTPYTPLLCTLFPCQKPMHEPMHLVGATPLTHPGVRQWLE